MWCKDLYTIFEFSGRTHPANESGRQARQSAFSVRIMPHFIGTTSSCFQKKWEFSGENGHFRLFIRDFLDEIRAFSSCEKIVIALRKLSIRVTIG
jgi:hypothetical protein